MTSIKIEIEIHPETAPHLIDGVMRTKAWLIDLALNAAIEGDGTYSDYLMGKVKNMKDVQEQITSQINNKKSKEVKNVV